MMIKKPKQPCSIYNLFFQLERECLLHEYIPNRSQDILREMTTSCKEGQNIYQSRDIDQRPLRYHHLTLPDNWFKSGRSKRKHRKTKLPFSFLQLNKIISKRWKLVDEETKEYLKRIASSEWKIYRANHKKYPEHNRTVKKTNDNFDGKNVMASSSIEYGCDPVPACKSNMELINTPSSTKKQLNNFYGNLNSNNGCDEPNCRLFPHEPWPKPLFSTCVTESVPDDTEALADYSDPTRHHSIPQVQQGHECDESMANGMFNARSKLTTSISQCSSMPDFQQQTKYTTPFNGHLIDINRDSRTTNSEFQQQNPRQFQQEDSKRRFAHNVNSDHLASVDESNNHDSQQIFSFTREPFTNPPFLCGVAQGKKRQNTQLQCDTLMFRPQGQIQAQVRDQNPFLPVSYQIEFCHDQSKHSPVDSIFTTENTSCQNQLTGISTRTVIACDNCRKFCFSCRNGSSFWNVFECSNNGSPANYLNEREVDSFSGIGHAVPMGLELEEMDDSDFPRGSFHPVDDSLTFHPNGGPWDF
ncbi:hypothetical protein ACHAXS_002790 [Conticribra weissflogii]